MTVVDTPRAKYLALALLAAGRWDEAEELVARRDGHHGSSFVARSVGAGVRAFIAAARAGVRTFTATSSKVVNAPSLAVSRST